MLKLIHRITFIELLGAVGEGVVLFTFVFLLRRLFNLTELLVAGRASMTTTIELVSSLLPSIILLTLPMAVLLATMMVYGRLVQENEFTALRSVGYSPFQLLVPAIILGLILTMMLLWWGHRIAPKGLRIVRETAADVLKNAATAGIRPSQFSHLGDMIISARGVNGGKMSHLKLFEERDGRIAGVISSPSASIGYSPENSSISFTLDDGRLHQMPHPERDVLIDFDRMTFSIGIPALLNKFARTGPEEQRYSGAELKHKTAELWQGYDQETNEKTKRWFFKKAKQMQMEQSRRYSLPAAALIMAVIGSLLGMLSGYGKRSSCYGLTILVIFLYYNLLNFGKTMVEDGAISPWLGLWTPNFIAAIFALYLLNRFRRL
ncbi:MAG: LptF/LptG family permease [Candidatus Hinthialibacter antarcticus]|nr:LptF/LptG family permease [Candidatus Hinthialibacter antarcticus]